MSSCDYNGLEISGVINGLGQCTRQVVLDTRRKLIRSNRQIALR